MSQNNIKIDTIQLKELLNKVDETGQNAWRIGETASRIKENKSFLELNFKNFDEYTNSEIGKSEVTINIYIKIFENFEFDEVGSMLFSHLKEFTKIKDDTTRKLALEAFRKLRNIYVKENDILKKEIVFTAIEVEKMANIISSEGNLSKSQVEDIVKGVLEVKSKKESTKPNKFGREFNFENFPKIKDLIACEPIDEQGTVALFCLLFEELKAISFPLNIDNTLKNVSFNKVKFIRSRFPDACIIGTYIYNKNEISTDIMIEFEYLSESYTTHLMSKEFCNLIVCWENNINRKIYKNVPPILSIKDFLQTGKLNIF